MRRCRVEIGPGAAFLGALLLLWLRGGELLALALPVAVHELGHLAAIRALGQRVVGFRASLCGLTIDCAGDGGPGGEAMIAAAGPLAGLLLAVLASQLGARSSCEWLSLAAGVSLLLSLFNLLPCLPLDGGRLFSALTCALLGRRRGERLSLQLSLAVSAALSAGGLLLLLRGRGAAPLLAGLALFSRQLWEQGLVKTPKVR